MESWHAGGLKEMARLEVERHLHVEVQKYYSRIQMIKEPSCRPFCCTLENGKVMIRLELPFAGLT
jgi:hypothetical protein